MRLVVWITKPNATIWPPSVTITEGDGPWPVFDQNGEEVGYVEWQKNAGKTEAELWEERRVAHWKMMREAWERYNELAAAHDAQGFNGRNPFE